MLLLVPVSTSQGIWKICDESSLLSQTESECEAVTEDD